MLVFFGSSHAIMRAEYGGVYTPYLSAVLDFYDADFNSAWVLGVRGPRYMYVR